MTFITAFFSRLGLKAILIGAAALAVLGIIMGQRRAGRMAERADRAKTVLKVKHDQLEAEKRRPSTGGLAKRLRDGSF